MKSAAAQPPAGTKTHRTCHSRPCYSRTCHSRPCRIRPCRSHTCHIPPFRSLQQRTIMPLSHLAATCFITHVPRTHCEDDMMQQMRMVCRQRPQRPVPGPENGCSAGNPTPSLTILVVSVLVVPCAGQGGRGTQGRGTKAEVQQHASFAQNSRQKQIPALQQGFA